MGKCQHFLIAICLFGLGIASCAKKKSDRGDEGSVSAARVSNSSPPPTSNPNIALTTDPALSFSDPSSTVATETDTSLSISVPITDAITANSTDTNTTITSESCEKLGSFWALNPRTQQCQSKILQKGHTYYVISTLTGGCISAKHADANGTMLSMLVPCKKDDDTLKWKFALEADNSFSLHPLVTPSECLGALDNQQLIPAPLSTNPSCGWASLFRIQASTSTADPNQVPVPISLVTDNGLNIPHPSNEVYNASSPLVLAPSDTGAFPWLLLDTSVDPLKAFLMLTAATQVAEQVRTKWTNRVLPRQFSDWMDLLPIDCGFSSIEKIAFSPIMLYGPQVGALQANYTCASTALHVPQCTETTSDCLDFPTGLHDYSTTSLLTKNSATDTNSATEFNYSCEVPSRLTAFWYQNCKDGTGRRQKVTRCCSSIGDATENAIPTENTLVWTADATNTVTNSTDTINTTGGGQTCRYLGCRTICAGKPIPSYTWVQPSTNCTNVSNELLLADIIATPTITCTPGTHLQSLSLSQNSDSQRVYTLTYRCTRIAQPQ